MSSRSLSGENNLPNSQSYQIAARKMLYNPPPLDRVIARACLKALDRPSANPGRDVLLHLYRELDALGSSSLF